MSYDDQGCYICRYCDGTGESSAGGACGFCDDGKMVQADIDARERFKQKLQEMRATRSIPGYTGPRAVKG